ncbi:MAG: GMP synthase-like glutamine amidotransferase [Candidatus Poriferisodalaceae bacterium]
MPIPRRSALIIGHEPDSGGGQVAIRLEERGFDVHTHSVTSDLRTPNDSVPFPDTAEYDLITVMGSIQSVTRPEEISTWIHDELDLIRTNHEAGTPILGICFGGQLIAKALGGTVEVAPVTEIGWHKISPIGDTTNPVGEGPWMEWHHDRFVPPHGAEVLAETDAATQLFRMGSTVGTQFHPEVDVQHISDWLANAPEEYLATYGQTKEALIEAVTAHEADNIRNCKALVDWFLDDVAFPPI